MLHACPACQRHHRAEAQCPHCGATTGASPAPFKAQGPWSRAVKKLKVGGLMAFTAATTSACYGTPAVVGLPEARPNGQTVPLDAMPVQLNRANVYLFDEGPSPSPSPSGAAMVLALAQAGATPSPSPEAGASVAASPEASGAASPSPLAEAGATPSPASSPLVASPRPSGVPMPRYSVGMELDSVRWEEGRLRVDLGGRFDRLSLLLELPEGVEPFALKEGRSIPLAQLASGNVQGVLNGQEVLFTMPGGAQSQGQVGFKPRPDGSLEMILVVAQKGRRLQINALMRRLR